MTSDRLDHVKEILSEALTLPAGRRAAFIDRASRGDEVVKAEALRLIEAGERMGGFLDRPLIEGDVADEPGALTGKKFKDRYLLGRFVGRGGYGDVYEARDELLAGRRVAVKILHQGALGSQHLMREIESLSALDHPGVVTPLDAGVLDCGRSCLVMRWVEGPTLRQLRREGRRFSAEFVLRLAHQLASAIGAAHTTGVWHLDLKPDNVIVTNYEDPEAYAVILDFGVGQLAQSGVSSATVMGRGGSWYSAPELREGSPTSATDFYSLGLILLELLTGKDRPGVLDIVEAPAGWRRVLALLIEPDPARRIKSSAQLLAALPGPKRERVLWAGAAAAIILAAVSGLFWGRPAPRTVMPGPVPFTSLPDEESHPHMPADGSRVYFSWSRGTGNPDIYVQLIGAPEPLRLTGHPAPEIHATASPGGEMLAFLRNLGSDSVELIVIPTAGGPEKRLATRGFNSIAWSPDGRFIAASVKGGESGFLRLEVFDLASGQWRLLVPAPPGTRGDLYPAFSPDGRQLVFARRLATNDAAVVVAPLDENLRLAGEPRILVRGLMNLVTPRWTPDAGTVLYLAGPASNRSLWAVAVDGGQPPARFPEAGDRLDQIATATGAWRLVASRSLEDFNVWRARLDGGGAKVSHANPIVASTWNDEEGRISPNGQWVAFISHRTGSEQVWISRIDGRSPEQVTSFAESDNLSVYWSPDSTRLMIAGNIGKTRHAIFQDYPGGKVSDAPLSGNELACGWSRDGKYIYYSADTPAGAHLGRKPVDGGPGQLVTRMPAVRAIESMDGRTVYFCTGRYAEGVWSVPVTGGIEKRVVPAIENRAFSVGAAGIYYISGGGTPVIRLSPHSGGPARDLLRLQRRSGFGFDISESAGFVVYTQLDHAGADLSLIDGYRF